MNISINKGLMMRLSVAIIASFALFIFTLAVVAHAAGTYQIAMKAGYPIVTGQTLSIQGFATSTSETGNDNTQHMAVDWGAGNGWEIANNSDFTWSPTFASGGFTATWNGNHTYTVGGTYAVKVMVYHGNTPGQDGSAQSTLSFNVVIPPSTGGLTITKTTTGGDGTFSFTGNGSIGSFTITTVNGVGSKSFYGLATSTTYSVTETTQTGWKQTSSNGCSGFTITAGATSTCAFANTKQGTLVVKKVVVNNDGGTKAASDFSFSVNGGSATAFNANGENDLTVDPGTYSITETTATGYATSYNNCSSVSVTAGGTATCTITNDDIAPTVKVVKTVNIQYNGSKTANDFSFLIDGNGILLNNVATTTKAGAHTLSEVAMAGYVGSSWGGDCGANGSITLSLGQNASCTITNSDQPGTLIVKKVVVGGPDAGHPENFSFSVNGGDAVAFNANGENDISESAGTYSISETSQVSGYVIGYSNCSNVVLANGGTQTCTITNTYTQGNIIITKNTVGGDGTFNFTATYSEGGFSLSGGQSNDSGLLTEGSYSVSETVPDGWVQTSATCDNGNDPTKITLNADQTVHCTFTNSKKPTLKLAKTVINDDAGTSTPADWTLTATGKDGFSDTGDSTTFHTVDANTGYTLSESSMPGYTNGSWSCDGGNQDGNTISLSYGDNVTCTVTNDDQPATITLHKFVSDPEEQGPAVATDWTLFATGPSTISGSTGSTNVTNAPVSAGTYVLSESGPGHYAAGQWTCSINDGQSFEGSTISLFNGDAADCSITNTFSPYSSDVSVTKTVDKQTPNNGDNVTYTITVSNAGPDTASNVSVTDLLPSGVSFVATSSEDTVGSYSTSTGVWTIGTVGTTSPAVLHITATVTASAGETVTNTAVVSSSTADPNSGNNSGSVSFTVNTPAPTPTPTPPSGGGGGNGPISGSLGGGQVLGASTSTVGQVLGASCGLYMDKHLRLGSKKNSTVQTTKLQQFLNKRMNAGLPVTGFYGPMTEAWVKKFQAQYASNVLTPWNINAPTGLVYLTTLRQINMIECPDLMIELPNLVDWSKNPNAQ